VFVVVRLSLGTAYRHYVVNNFVAALSPRNASNQLIRNAPRTVRIRAGTAATGYQTAGAVAI